MKRTTKFYLLIVSFFSLLGVYGIILFGNII